MGTYNKSWKGWLPVIVSLLVFSVIAAWMLHGVHEASEVSDREGLRMAERAVREAAVSVYALEGAYPSSYEDLRARSGIAVDDEKYMVFYEIFASNIFPEITVLEREVAGR